jgi:spore coat polysaccharide biosynthesis protein SpsF (cytidylyltransferase family)
MDQWKHWANNTGGVSWYTGHDHDPLARLYDAAISQGIDTVIRVTHDKIFVDPCDVLSALQEFEAKKLDYLFSSTLTAGSGFEIISIDALALAREKFTGVEHVSYAVRAVTDNIWDMPFTGEKGVRLLCDYEEDLVFLETVLSTLGNDCTKRQVEAFCKSQRWVNDLNRLPNLTIYTCAYNADEWISETMESVASQEGFKNFEYILIDDCSTDKTMYRMAKFKSRYQNVKLVRNAKNIGLASSSNIALKNARGKFIVRLDADDYFTSQTSCRELLGEIGARPVDAIYPANYYGSTSIIQQPEQQHHVGGSIFRTSALNHIKFTEGMRGFEGVDLYARAREQLRIGYFSRPTFFYRQHPTSLSKSNPQEREQIKQSLVEKYGAEVASNRHP